MIEVHTIFDPALVDFDLEGCQKQNKHFKKAFLHTNKLNLSTKILLYNDKQPKINYPIWAIEEGQNKLKSDGF